MRILKKNVEPKLERRADAAVPELRRLRLLWRFQCLGYKDDHPLSVAASKVVVFH